MHCVSELDLYTECLEEEEMYIPKKFRRDRTHYRDANEKREIERMNYERMKSQMQILNIRKESYMREIEQIKKEDEEYFRNEIEDVDVLENVLEIWHKSMKKDEENSDDQCRKNREAMRRNYEKDKEELRKKEARSTSQPAENREINPSRNSTSNTLRASATVQDNQREPVTEAHTAEEMVPRRENFNDTRSNYILNSTRTANQIT